jgi:uncharacterized protein with FMN-binding domain
VASTVLLASLSVAGGVAANDLWLNPDHSIFDTITGAWTSGSSASANGEQVVTGDAIDYRFGTVQLQVTSKNGTITAIEELQATATDAWESAFPVLNQSAIEANGSSFGNLGGATYTSEAYRAALDSALSKLG